MNAPVKEVERKVERLARIAGDAGLRGVLLSNALELQLGSRPAPESDRRLARGRRGLAARGDERAVLRPRQRD
jgi:hypothetical protein